LLTFLQGGWSLALEAIVGEMAGEQAGPSGEPPASDEEDLHHGREAPCGTGRTAGRDAADP